MADKKELSADDKFERLLGQLVEGMKATSLSEDKLEAILVKSGLATAAGMQKAIRPENEQPPLISAFNPDGDRDHPKRPLNRKTYLNGHPEHNSDSSLQADMLMQAEIDAYNELGAMLEGQADKRAFSRGDLYRAELRNRNTELHIEVPVANLDTRSNLPPTLIMLCHELKTGESMMDLNALLAEVTRLRAELERRGGPAARPVHPLGAKPTMAPSGPLVSDLAQTLDATPVSALAGKD